MSDDLDDLLSEITFEPPDHLEAPPWPVPAAPPRRWPLAAATALLLAAAAALLALRLPAEPAQSAGEPPSGWPAVAHDDQLRWLLDADTIVPTEQLALRSAPMCPPPAAATGPYCMGLR